MKSVNGVGFLPAVSVFLYKFPMELEALFLKDCHEKLSVALEKCMDSASVNETAQKWPGSTQNWEVLI